MSEPKAAIKTNALLVQAKSKSPQMRAFCLTTHYTYSSVFASSAGAG